ncbi:MAG TPA: peptidoglycan bridge formation glycyltransferase FemA/FemB family protein [Candidatus Agrococcus pullicola]|uniref:Peptidoglycan bridge formation glycyltransferase FemA/FemB family protein n=1 Tax=Candidatus Agrococcus pullicola TaxID=2838429 RepID=A0A9D2C8P4_9MICO|nr:peptidoglycan bridge formation glycyltransferase FemA/FemB family protein [Candidatus Agrococcus pullicola]
MPELQARWATDYERERWDELVAANPAAGDFRLSESLAVAKQTLGVRPRHLVFERGDEIASVALVLERRIPLTGRQWYIPRGPAVTTVADFAAHLDALRRFLRQARPGVFHVLMDPPVQATEGVDAEIAASASLTAPDIARRPGVHANNRTVIVPIDKDDDALLMAFNKKTRNMVRRAMKDSVEIKQFPATDETFSNLHRLMAMAGGGKDDLELRPREYVEALWRENVERGDGFFLGAEVNAQPAVMAFVSRCGTSGYYEHGGSDRELQSPGMANLLQYEAMRLLRDEGCTTYDMLGVAPSWAKSNDDHPAYAFGQFKLGFGPRVEYIGGWDLQVRQPQARLWLKIGERGYNKLYQLSSGDVSIY